MFIKRQVLVNAAPGANAARVILADLKKRR